MPIPSAITRDSKLSNSTIKGGTSSVSAAFCRSPGRPSRRGSRGLRPSILPGSWTKNVAPWSLRNLEGYSRTILAGAMAPTEATWAALMVLYTACVRYGAPPSLVSDSGGAYTSDAFEAVCGRLEIDHKTIVSTQGESDLNWIETHFT